MAAGRRSMIAGLVAVATLWLAVIAMQKQRLLLLMMMMVVVKMAWTLAGLAAAAMHHLGSCKSRVQLSSADV
jgi:hypothetical protein